MESEKATERYLNKRVQELGGLTYKFSAEFHAGVPDRICVLPGGIVFFVEIKSEGEQPTSLQQHVHIELRARGIDVHVVDTKAEVNDVLNAYRRAAHDNG